MPQMYNPEQKETTCISKRKSFRVDIRTSFSYYTCKIPELFWCHSMLASSMVKLKNWNNLPFNKTPIQYL